MMDLRAIRAALGVLSAAANFNAWDYIPDDPQHLPAAVVDGILSLDRLNAHVTQFDITITFYASGADPKDASARLDLLLSTGITGSFADLLTTAAAVLSPAPPWRTIKLKTAGPYTRYAMPNGELALGVQITLELTA